MKEKRNSNKIGSVAKLSIKADDVFKIEDLMYVFSYRNKIADLYDKLRLIHARGLKKTNRTSYTDFAKKQKIDLRLMPLMKEYGYCDDDNKWKLQTPPHKADAVFLQLKIRDSYRKAKNKS